MRRFFDYFSRWMRGSNDSKPDKVRAMRRKLTDTTRTMLEKHAAERGLLITAAPYIHYAAGTRPQARSVRVEMEDERVVVWELPAVVDETGADGDAIIMAMLLVKQGTVTEDDNVCVTVYDVQQVLDQIEDEVA
ncbi:MAG TPA: hypothetical protein VM118_14390 [Acidobacteriota bacterium]|nr:hypothetical protein [Acidobacteriota bacterium]